MLTNTEILLFDNLNVQQIALSYFRNFGALAISPVNFIIQNDLYNTPSIGVGNFVPHNLNYALIWFLSGGIVTLLELH